MRVSRQDIVGFLQKKMTDEEIDETLRRADMLAGAGSSPAAAAMDAASSNAATTPPAAGSGEDATATAQSAVPTLHLPDPATVREALPDPAAHQSPTTQPAAATKPAESGRRRPQRSTANKRKAPGSQGSSGRKKPPVMPPETRQREAYTKICKEATEHLESESAQQCSPDDPVFRSVFDCVAQSFAPHDEHADNAWNALNPAGKRILGLFSKHIDRLIQGRRDTAQLPDASESKLKRRNLPAMLRAQHHGAGENNSTQPRLWRAVSDEGTDEGAPGAGRELGAAAVGSEAGGGGQALPSPAPLAPPSATSSPFRGASKGQGSGEVNSVVAQEILVEAGSSTAAETAAAAAAAAAAVAAAVAAAEGDDEDDEYGEDDFEDGDSDVDTDTHYG